MMNDECRQMFWSVIHHSSFIIHRFPPRLAVFSAVWLAAGCLSAQVMRLPAVTPPEQGPPGQLVSHPDSPAEILQAPGETGAAPEAPAPSEPQLPPGVRNGFFQKVLFDYTWLAPGGADGLGVNDIELQGVFALPCPTPDSPLVITPGFGVQYLQGPQNADLPPQLCDGYLQFRWLSQVTPRLGLDLAITPGIFSDFQQSSSKAFRLTGHAAGAWTWSETAKFAFGAAYQDMPSGSNNIIPVGGLIWTPREDLKFDLVFPHPKISRRIYCWSGQYGDGVQDWFYVAGEFANDAWAIRRADGSDDQAALSDYRLILGLERKVIGGLSSRVEAGYVFGRRIRYTSDTPDFYPADTVMLRGGLSY